MKLLSNLEIMVLRVLFFYQRMNIILKKKEESEIRCLAKDFEIFLHDDKLFMSHMYSSGVYHWRTKKSGDHQYWLSLIDNIEKKIEKV